MANTCGTERIIEADCRATTSHRLVRVAERLGYLTLIEASPYFWEGETFTRFACASLRRLSSIAIAP